MSAQLKTHLAEYGGGRTIIKKWLIGKRMFNFKFTVMREPDLQRITFLGFKIFKIFQNFKTTFGYHLIFVSLFHFISIPVNSVWLDSLKGMNKFHFLRSLFSNMFNIHRKTPVLVSLFKSCRSGGVFLWNL